MISTGNQTTWKFPIRIPRQSALYVLPVPTSGFTKTLFQNHGPERKDSDNKTWEPCSLTLAIHHGGKNHPHIHLQIYNSFNFWAKSVKFNDFIYFFLSMCWHEIKYVGEIIIFKNCHKVWVLHAYAQVKVHPYFLKGSHGWIFTHGAHRESFTV